MTKTISNKRIQEIQNTVKDHWFDDPQDDFTYNYGQSLGNPAEYKIFCDTLDLLQDFEELVRIKHGVPLTPPPGLPRSKEYPSY